MPLFRFFRRAVEKRAESAAPATAPSQASSSVSPASPPPSAPSAPGESPIAPVASVTPAAETEVASAAVDQAIQMFETIQQIMGRGEDVVRIPARILLTSLPPEFRGPAWDDTALPNTHIELERGPLLQQLQKGRVVYRLNDLAMGVPPGWIKPDAEAVVELNLAELVTSLPPEMFQVTSQLDEELIEVAQMRDYFAPGRAAGPEVAVPAAAPTPAAGAEVSAEAASAAAPAAAEMKRREVPLTARDGWDGVDHVPDAGPETVDLNEADEATLSTVPGLSGKRAHLVLEYRRQYGPFRSIFELLAVPGIGWSAFRKATGLEPGLRKRRDRHTVLNELLGWPVQERPSLAQIASRVAEVFAVRGCVLAGTDGMVLAQSPGLEGDASRYAALAPKLYRRTRRYLTQLTAAPVNALMLPTAQPPLLIFLAAHVHMVLALQGLNDLESLIGRAAGVAAEVDWLLSRRVVVRVRPAEAATSS